MRRLAILFVLCGCHHDEPVWLHARCFDHGVLTYEGDVVAQVWGYWSRDRKQIYLPDNKCIFVQVP